jgi:glucose-6-phosphate 1-dehydrogenase
LRGSTRYAVIASASRLPRRRRPACWTSIGYVGDNFDLTCASREDWTTEQFQGWAANQLDRHAESLPMNARRAVANMAHYRAANVTDAAEVAAAVAGNGPTAVYLALPPALFPITVAALHRGGFPAGSRIVLEKPFGEDLESAIHLNRLLAELLPEPAVFRVDHFLAMTTVQNVLGSRLANRILESVWDSAHIAEVEIAWDETLALEGRAGYFDGVGSLKDMVQNHLLQLLCLIAMEPPLSLDERDLRDRKLDVLRSVRTMTEDDVRHRTRRARYAAGRVDGQAVPAYVHEDGVDPHRGTETYAEVELEVENWRWSGTTFRLRSGKAFATDRKEAAVHFRPVPHLPFGHIGEATPNVLWFGLEPEQMALDLVGVGSRPHTLAPVNLIAPTEPAALPAYGRVLLDALNGNAALSIRGDEAEESWRVMSPILSAWSKDLVPLEECAAGSPGPVSRPKYPPTERSLDLGI